MKKFFILLSVLLVPLWLAASAAAYSVSYVDGITYNTSGLAGLSTDGADMDGMTIVATDINGNTNTGTWVHSPDDADKGGASGYLDDLAWYLSLDGDSFTNYWTLTLDLDNGLSLRSLAIDAGDGNSVFDVKRDAFYSPDSGFGTPFDTSYSCYLAATYSNRVMVGGTFYGDLYRNLSLDFGDNGLTSSIDFVADTDNLDDLNPAQPVPEPGTIFLTGTGLLGLAFARRRLKTKKE